MTNFNLTKKERIALLQLTIDRLEQYYGNTGSYRLSPTKNADKFINEVEKNGFDDTTAPQDAILDVIDALQQSGPHASHPKYFGLFVPRVNFPSIVSDLIIAVFKTAAQYMATDTKNTDAANPFTQSIQWTRRFIGLRLYLSLRIFGWEGYDQIIENQTKIGQYLRKRLLDNNWSIKNKTPIASCLFYRR